MARRIAIPTFRRHIGLIILAVAILIVVGACSTGAPSLDEPDVTALPPTATAAG
jgi:hypothetical protein